MLIYCLQFVYTVNDLQGNNISFSHVMHLLCSFSEIVLTRYNSLKYMLKWLYLISVLLFVAIRKIWA